MRYIGTMVLLALLAAAAVSEPPSSSRSPASPVLRQANATVRILQGVRIDPEKLPDTAVVRQVSLRQDDGSERTVRLVEFP